MALEIGSARGIEFAIEIAVEDGLRQIAAHDRPPVLAAAAGWVRTRCSRWRARASADITVPMGTDVIAAISL
jgi:hypothetical protein